MLQLTDKVLCLTHLIAGVVLIVIAGVLEATGNGGTVTTGMFAVGATLLPTAPSALLRRPSGAGGTLIPDTIAAVTAGAQIAGGHTPAPPVPPTPQPAAPGAF